MSLNTPAAVTARVRLGNKKHQVSRDYDNTEQRWLDSESVSAVHATFFPDYANGANAEWAASTPVITIDMTIRPDLDAFFKANQAFELTFRPIDG